MRITGLDHLVLTVRDMDVSVTFYSDALGLTPVTFGQNRRGLLVGAQRINLHEAGRELAPYASRPVPGAADLCLASDTPVEVVLARLTRAGVTIELGPVERVGAAGPMRSFYVRDPDGNLVEVGCYDCALDYL